MANIKSRYNDLRWEYDLDPKSWIHKKYGVLAWEAYDDDLKPYDELDLSGKYLAEFNNDYFKNRQTYILGKYYDYIPAREKVTKQRVYDEYNYEIERQNDAEYKGPIANIDVPNDLYDKWAHLNPRDYIGDYNNRKNIIDAYLSNFDEEKRLRLKQTMSNNYDGQNYVWFLEKDFNSMNEKQKSIYEDIINFYEEVYLNDLKNERDMIDQIELSKEVYQQNKLDKISDKKDENIFEEFDPIDPKDLMYETQDESMITLNKPINFQNNKQDELMFKPHVFINEQSNSKKINLQQPDFQTNSFEQFNIKRPNFQQSNIQQFNIKRPDSQQSNLQQFNIKRPDSQQSNLQQFNIKRPDSQQSNLQQFNIKRPDSQQSNIQQFNIKRPDSQQTNFQQFNFEKNQTIVDAKKPIIVNDEYIKNYKIIPSTQFGNLFNVPQCYNVANLIYARKEAEVRNNELINDMISEQIITNNFIIDTVNVDNINQNIENKEIPITNFR